MLDTWFSSALWPFSTLGWPDKDAKDLQYWYPTSVLVTGYDIIFFWVARMIFSGMEQMKKEPFKTVLIHGLVRDDKGRKMSKSLGNGIDPLEMADKFGADALRFNLITGNSPGNDMRFFVEKCEAMRNFANKIWNASRYVMMNLTIERVELPEKLELEDKWILSKLNTLIKRVDDDLWNYRVTEPALAIQDFVDELSNWYVRRGRERYWVQGLPEDKIAAYMTLYTALVTTAKAAAPMIPFMTESIYQNLVRSVDKSAPESIHLCAFPTVDEKAIDKELEDKMDKVLEIVVLGRAARNGSSLKNRQPLATMYVKLDGELDSFYTDIIRDELNIKNVSFTDKVDDFVTYQFKPQLRTVGPKYGKYLKQIQAALSELDGNAAMKELKENGCLKLDSVSSEVVLLEEDLLITMTQAEGFVTEGDNNVTVVMDTRLTPELIEEGFVRELISKIQTMRKEAGFEVMDHIAVSYTADEKVTGIFNKYGEKIQTEVLANAITAGTLAGYQKEWSINGEKVTLAVEKQ